MIKAATFLGPWGAGGGGDVLRQFRIGVCRKGSQTLTLFKDRK